MDGDDGIKELQEYVLGKIAGASPPKVHVPSSQFLMIHVVVHALRLKVQRHINNAEVSDSSKLSHVSNCCMTLGLRPSGKS